MKSGKQIGIGILLLLLFGCGSSDDESLELAQEAGLRNGDQKIVGSPPTGGAAQIPEERDKPESKEPGAPSSPAPAVKKEEIKSARKAERPTPKVEIPQPVKVPVPEKIEIPQPVVVSAAEPEVVRAPSPPRPTGETSEAEVPETARPNSPQQVEESPAVLVAPSPPRRVPSGTPAGPGPVVVAENRTDFATVMLPAGSVVEIRTVERISSKSNLSGDLFEATLVEPLVVDGKTLFGRGSEVHGHLVEVLRPGKVKGRGSVTFALREIRREDTNYTLETNRITIEAESTKGKDAAKVGAASAIGAVLGAVFGGKKGAAIGGATAGGAGAAGVLLSRGKDVEIPAERLFSFRLEKDIEIRIR